MAIISVRPPLATLLLVLVSSPVLAQQDNRLLYELLNRIELLEQELRELRGEMEVFRYRQEQEIADIQNFRQRLLNLEDRPGAAGAAPPTVQAMPGAQTQPPLPRQAPERPATDTPPVAVAPPVPRQAPERPAPDTPPVAAATPPPAQAAPTPPAPSNPASPLTESEQAAYDTAFGRLREGQYDQAVQAFQSFLQQYPGSSLAGNAQYWLGEVYYVMREFDAARDTFLELGSRYPDSNRLPDTLLKLGYIYEEQGDSARAREVYGKLMELYPGSRPAGLAEQRLAVLP